MTGFSPTWLALREGADADARAAELAGALGSAPDHRVIHDLGCGTGSMGRWLAARLPGPQHWVLYDHDPDLLAHAAATMPDTSADGAAVTVETRRRDVTRLTAGDLTGAALVTCSALLDLLTRDEVDRLAAAITGAGCQALLTLSVIGQVELRPTDPLDAMLGAAFDAHQRRVVDGRRLLGPDAVDAAVAAFRRHGRPIAVRPSPWQLGPDRAELTAEWLNGWVAAAVEQYPELAKPAAPYLDRRLADIAAGRLAAHVGHIDLLAG